MSSDEEKDGVIVTVRDADIVQQSDAGEQLTMLAIIARAVADPSCDVDKMERVVALKERLDATAAKEKYGLALAKFQSICPIVKRNKEAKGSRMSFKYAGLDDVMRQVKPAMSECGLSVSFSSEPIGENKIHTTITIRHGTHAETSEFTCPVPSQMTVNDTQKMGAALSYARRYAICGALNITVSDDDDDANFGPAAGMDLKSKKEALVANVAEIRKGAESSMTDVQFIQAVVKNELRKAKIESCGECDHVAKVIFADKAYDPATAEKFPDDK